MSQTVRLNALFLSLWCLLAAASASAGAAGSSNWVETQESQIRLIASRDALEGDGPLILGLQFRLEPGWKIYWRFPGDTGFPPQFDWSGSTNLGQATVQWPLPKRFDTFGLTSFGYGDQVVLPIRMVPEKPGDPVRVKLALYYGICKEVCIPHDATFSLDLAAGPGRATPFAKLIRRYQAKVPLRGGTEGLEVVGLRLTEHDKPALSVTLRSDRPDPVFDLFVEGAAGHFFGTPKPTRRSEPQLYEVTLPIGGRRPAGRLIGKSLTVTATDGRSAIETVLPVVR